MVNDWLVLYIHDDSIYLTHTLLQEKCPNRSECVVELVCRQRIDEFPWTMAVERQARLHLLPWSSWITLFEASDISKQGEA